MQVSSMLKLYLDNDFEKASPQTKLPLMCLNCGETFYKTKREIEQVLNHCGSKTLDFCCKTCSANFLNKTYRHRSKFEIFLEEYLRANLPEYLSNLPIVYNSRDLFPDDPHEVDIYLPTIKVAVEVNGTHHYKPIFGEKRFEETIKNDQAVESCCYRYGILLVIMNMKDMDHFNERDASQHAKALLDIIIDLHREYNEKYKKTNTNSVTEVH